MSAEFEKLNLLFNNADAVLQRAGFYKAPCEGARESDCYVNLAHPDPGAQHRVAVEKLKTFLEKLDVSDINNAREEVLNHIGVTNDGSHIFDIPSHKR